MFSSLSPDEHGLVAVGGDLRPERLLAAYRHGVFPWYEEDGPILWWSPDPRGIIPLDGFHIPRRLERTLCSSRFAVTHDREFAGVIRGCAERTEGTWITAEMINAYEALHRSGHAHSVEVWRDGALAGGLYGVAIGGLFAGESMFSRQRDASKIALIWTCTRLRERGFELFDVQMVTPHTARFGAAEVSRSRYLALLGQALGSQPRF